MELLPVEILENEVWPFLPLFEEALYDLDHGINVEKWKRWLRHADPGLYHRLTQHNFNLHQCLNDDKYEDNVVLILLMMGTARVHNVYTSITTDDTAPVYAILLLRKFRPTKILKLVMALKLPFLMTILYLFQHGAKVDAVPIIDILRRAIWHPVLAQLVKFLCSHRESYRANDMLLNLEGEYVYYPTLLSLIIASNPGLAAELIDAPGINLTLQYKSGGDYQSYLALVFVMFLNKFRDPVKRRACQHIIRVIYQRHPQTVNFRHPYFTDITNASIVKAINSVV